MSYSIHKWVVHKGGIQEKMFPRQQPILHISTSSKFQNLGLNTRQSDKKEKKGKQERRRRKKLKQCRSPYPTSPSLGYWLAIALFFTSKPQVRDRPKWFEVTNGCHGTIYCSSTLLPVAASTSKNDTLAMELASRMKVPTTTSRLSMPESFYKKPLPQT